MRPSWVKGTEAKSREVGFFFFFSFLCACVLCVAFTTIESIYYLKVTMGMEHFISAPFVDSPPLRAPSCLSVPVFWRAVNNTPTVLVKKKRKKACVRPCGPITFWRQWPSERDDSRRQLGVKRDIAVRECTIIRVMSLKSWGKAV